MIQEFAPGWQFDPFHEKVADQDSACNNLPDTGHLQRWDIVNDQFGDKPGCPPKEGDDSQCQIAFIS